MPTVTRSTAPVALLVGLFGALVWLERRKPLRSRVAPELPRSVRNAATGAGAALVVACLQGPITERLGRRAAAARLGIVPRLGLPPATARVLTLLLLDYTLYVWHRLLHDVPALWRWHRIHHDDPDLDVSTALRFHALEMAWSVPWRIGQVIVIGVPPETLALWARLTIAEVLFHHANLRLPDALDRALGLIVATPRLHGIHHSNIEAHQQANLSSGLTLWDMLHGTLLRDVPQRSITIGLPVDDPQR